MKLIKSNLLFLLMLQLFCWNTQAQSWQWGKSGGVSMALPINEPEAIKSIATDLNGNVYTLSPTGIGNINIDGHIKPTWGIDGKDIVITSFSCDGTYRWSKVIGGEENDEATNLQVDAQGNVYVTGYIINNADDFLEPGIYPKVHFDTDLILPYALQNAYSQTCFLLKYDTNGVLQWLKFPQAATISNIESDNMATMNIQVDPMGNIFWITVMRKPGTFADGALQITQAELGVYILRYDTNGNYLSASMIDLQYNHSTILGSMCWVRNHNTGNFYVAGDLVNVGTGELDVLTVGGQSTTKGHYLVAFNANGSFLWKAVNNTVNVPGSYVTISLDSDNNIYLDSTAHKVTELSGNIMDSFNGVQFTPPLDYNNLPVTFVTKLDQNGNTLWQTNSQTNNNIPTSITVNGNEVAIAGGIAGAQQWNNVNVTIPSSKGYDVYIARFNKQTGAIINIDTFTSNANSNDLGTVLTKDTQGNYLMGGHFGGSVTVGPSTLQTNGDSDFFIAKFGTNNCPLSVETPVFKDLNVYPNPVQSQLYIDNEEPMQYELYNVLGKKIQSGSLAVHGQLDCSGLSSGLYLLQLQNQKGETKMVKVSRL